MGAGSFYPMCAGHELLGRVTEVGAKVTKFKEGDFCAVGWYENSTNSFVINFRNYKS